MLSQCHAGSDEAAVIQEVVVRQRDGFRCASRTTAQLVAQCYEYEEPFCMCVPCELQVHNVMPVEPIRCTCKCSVCPQVIVYKQFPEVKGRLESTFHGEIRGFDARVVHYDQMSQGRKFGILDLARLRLAERGQASR